MEGVVQVLVSLHKPVSVLRIQSINGADIHIGFFMNWFHWLFCWDKSHADCIFFRFPFVFKLWILKLPKEKLAFVYVVSFRNSSHDLRPFDWSEEPQNISLTSKPFFPPILSLLRQPQHSQSFHKSSVCLKHHYFVIQKVFPTFSM